MRVSRYRLTMLVLSLALFLIGALLVADYSTTFNDFKIHLTFMGIGIGFTFYHTYKLYN